MFKLNLENTICELRTILCPPDKDNPNKGIIFQVKLDLCYPTNYQFCEIRRNAFVAICGNTKIFVAIEKENDRWDFWPSVPKNQWINTSNHDIGWRSDGMRAFNDFHHGQTKNIPLYCNVTDHSHIVDISNVIIESELQSGQNYKRDIKLIKMRY